MRVLKISIYQRKLGSGIDLATAKNLSNLKTDFLVLPEFYYADDQIKDYPGLAVNSTYAIDWLQKLSESQTCILIGGTMLRKFSARKYRISVPIFYQGKLINWYDKRELTSDEQQIAQRGKNDGIEMLKNLRFGILCGKEFNNKKLIEEYGKKNVSLVFLISNSPKNEIIEKTYAKIEELAKKHQICFIRCSGIGTMLGSRIYGRSFVCLKNGISWKLSEQETNKELLKTVIVNL